MISLVATFPPLGAKDTSSFTDRCPWAWRKASAFAVGFSVSVILPADLEAAALDVDQRRRSR